MGSHPEGPPPHYFSQSPQAFLPFKVVATPFAINYPLVNSAFLLRPVLVQIGNLDRSSVPRSTFILFAVFFLLMLAIQISPTANRRLIQNQILQNHQGMRWDRQQQRGYDLFEREGLVSGLRWLGWRVWNNAMLVNLQMCELSCGWIYTAPK